MARCFETMQCIFKLEYSQMESSLLGDCLYINMKQAPENLMSEHYS